MTGESSRVSRIFRSTFPPEAEGFRTRAWIDGVAETADQLKPLYSTMLHAFAFAAKEHEHTGIALLPDDPAGRETHATYRSLYHHASSMAVALRDDHGVQPGDPVMLVLPTSLEFVAALFAIQLIGAIPVPAYPPAVLARARQAIERLRQIADSSGATVCVTERRLKPLFGEVAAAGRLRDIVPVDMLHGDRKALGHVRVRGDDPALIQYTSGSTDRPKGVLLSHRNLVSNVHAIGQAAQVTRKDRGVVWLPLYHDMGLIGGLMFFVYWRLPLVLMSPMAFLSDPLRWLRTMSRERATLSPAPNFAYGLCARRAEGVDLGDLDLSHWRLALNGAEPVNPATVRAFTERFAPHGFRAEAMLPVYGLAEGSLAAAFPPPGSLPEVEVVDRDELAAGRVVAGSGDRAVAVTSVGQAVPGHTIDVVDEQGRSVPVGEVGHVVVSGPSVMKGYHRNPEATAAVLHGETLWTGDLGFRSAGRLFVVGRAKDLIIVRGRNYYAEDIERVALSVPGARAGGVAAFGVYDEAEAVEHVVVVCETRLDDTDARLALVRGIDRAVNERIGVPVDEVVLARPGTIPRTSSGKIQRSHTRTLYVDGSLGRSRGGKLGVALTFVRSGAGFIAARARRLLNS